jgi:hypothetical protein
MNANELADELEKVIDVRHYASEVLRKEVIAMLHQQQAEIEVLKADNGHYRDMAVDFLKCREPYGWFSEKGNDYLFFRSNAMKNFHESKGVKFIPLYLHPSIQEQEK